MFRITTSILDLRYPCSPPHLGTTFLTYIDVTDSSVSQLSVLLSKCKCMCKWSNCVYQAQTREVGCYLSYPFRCNLFFKIKVRTKKQRSLWRSGVFLAGSVPGQEVITTIKSGPCTPSMDKYLKKSDIQNVLNQGHFQVIFSKSSVFLADPENAKT